jgi:hypothetical protein
LEDVRRLFVAVFVVAFAFAVEACGQCNAHCEIGATPIFEVQNGTITSATSSCDNVKNSGSGVSGSPLQSPATCHFDITASDGTTHAFDVPFTYFQRECCCGPCIEGYTGNWTKVTLTLPYTPDASPFPPYDAAVD